MLVLTESVAQKKIVPDSVRSRKLLVLTDSVVKEEIVTQMTQIYMIMPHAGVRT